MAAALSLAAPPTQAADAASPIHVAPTTALMPTLDSSFSPGTIPYDGVTTMTLLIDNSAAGSIDRNIGFIDNLATGLQIATPANATTTCGGTLSAVPGADKVTLSGGNIAASAICSVSVNVTNRAGFAGLCYNPNFANENRNLVGLQNLVAQIEQDTCVSVTPPDCPDSATTNGFGNIGGLSPNLDNGVSGHCIAVKPTIELVKISESGIGSFGFTLANTGATNPVTIATTAPGAPGTSGGVFDVLDMAQPVTITESALPAGWTLSSIACQLKDGTPIGRFDAPSGTWSVDAGDLAYGQQIRCTATNLSPPDVALAKALTGESGTQPGIAEPGEQLTYAITLTNTGGTAATSHGVTDTLDPNVSFVSASNGGALAGGSVVWTGLTVPANGSLTLTVVVRVNDPIPAGVTQIGNVAYETGTPPPTCPPAGPQCVIVPSAARIAITKSASAPASTGAPNQYTITYVVTATNSGGSGGSYDLADALTFNGATVTMIGTPLHASSTGDPQSGTLGSFVAPAGGTIVTGEPLAAGGVETWTYTVTYTITDGAVAADCASPSGGLRNHAALGGAAAGAPAVDTCSGAPSVSIVKTASVPLPTGNANEYTLTYTVNVNNTGSLGGVYDLTDTLAFNGATVTAIGAPAHGSATGDTQDGVLGAFAAPSGGTIVSGETIAAGGAETWIYAVTYTVTSPSVAQDCVGAGAGLRNQAQLGGSMSGESATCTGAPAVSLGKSASGPTPTGNPNEYALDYLVTVQNNGTLTGTYDLSDAFTFSGVTVVAASAITHAGSDPLSAPLGTLGATGGAIVTGETIMAGATETYAYRVTFRLDDAQAVGTCASSGGLRNRAALGGSSAGQVDTCSDVPDIAVAKTAGAPVPTGVPNQYTLAYTVTVTNGGAAGGSYDLADAFAFAGATVDAVSTITHAGPDPLATALGTLSTAGGTIVTGETIAAGSNERYTYTVTLTLTDSALAGDCADPAGGLRNTAALGGSAVGEAPTCTGAPNVAIAKALTGENGNLPGEAEPGEQLTYTITLTNSGGSDATNQAVADALDPNVTFVSASNGGTQVGAQVQWSGLTVPAHGSLTLTVVVQVVDPIPSGVMRIGNVAYDPVFGPPDCGAMPMPANCTSTPTPPVVTLAKALTGESGTQPGIAEPGETLTYTITLTNSGGGAALNYGVTDRLDPNTSFVSATNGGAHAAGLVNWTGLTVPAGGSLTLTVVVKVVDPIPAGVTQIGNVAYETGTPPPACPPAGPQCVVVPTAAQVALAKALTGESGSQPGIAEPGEALTYTITLSNAGGTAATNYGVTDRLDPNTTFVSATNGGTHAGGLVAWSGLTVPANGSLTLTVVVTVIDPIPAGVTQIGNVAYETGTTPPACPPAGPQCVVVPTAAAVALNKSASAPAPTGVPNQYTITYTVTATNRGGSVGTYDLADTLTFNGATVTAISAPVHASSTGDIQDGALGSFVAPAGGTIVTGERIGALGSETWTYTVTYTVTDAAVAADCASASGGLRNHAALGGASAGAPPADACTGAPSVGIVKTAGPPQPAGAPNTFTLTYTIEVTNAGTLIGSYDLSDTLTFNGATVNAISTPAHNSSTGDTQDGTLGTFVAPNGGTIVSGETIAAGGAERWTYTVTYTVTDAGTAQDCGSPSGGLRNRASLGGAMSGESATCTGAPAVVLGKSVSGPTPTGNPREYRLSYLVTVQNDGTLPGLYDLDDAFTFNGVTVVAVSAVTHGGSDPLDTPLGTLAATGGRIVTGEGIAAGANETYGYSVTFTLDSVSGVGTCAGSGGLRNQAALGGSASGQVGTCSDVPDIAVAKTASGPVPTGVPNQYTLTYTVTATNAGAASGAYDLADTFAFAGATVDAVGTITHAGPDPLSSTLGTLSPAGGTIVTGETIAAGSSERYTYTVTFTLTDPALADDCANPAGGLRNAAALGGSAAGDARTCTGTPQLAIGKALTGESGSLPGVAEPGETLTYTITLTNTGSSAAVDQRIVDRLDPNVTFVSASNGGTQVGGNIEWTGLTVPAQGSLTLTVVVKVVDPIPAGVTAIGNVAYDPTIGQPDCTAVPRPANCTSTPTPAVVTIAKALSGESGVWPGVAEPGETLTYTITLTNTGGSDATNYGVTDRLDPNTSFVSATSGGTHAGGLVTWAALTVPANGSITLTVVVTVNDPIPAGVTQIGNVAYETGTPPPACPPAGPQCVIVPTAGAVVIAKALSGEDGNLPGLAEPGEQLTYTITLTNTGGTDATNYCVTDTLDPNVTFVSASNGGTHIGGAVSWSGLTVPAGSSLTLTVVVRVVDPIPAGVTQIGNVAYETGTTPPACPPAGPQCVIVPTAGAVTIAKSVVDANANGIAEPGETLTYTIMLTNTGGSAVNNYGVTDPLDPNTTFVSADHGGVHAGGIVTWNGLSVPANGALGLTVVVTVNDPLPRGVTRIGNLAYESGMTPPDCAATPQPANCAIIPVPDGTPQLSLRKTANTTVLQPGGTVVYTITVANVGTVDATNVTISDPLPAGVASYVWTCAAAGGVVCPRASGNGAIAETVATFPPGGTLVYTVTATLTANPPETVVNTATVTPPDNTTCAPDGAQPPCVATVIGTVVAPAEVRPVPVSSRWALLLLALGVVGVAGWRRRLG